MQNKKTLGQNFLTDKNKISEIIEVIPNLSTSTIFEVGPGKGALTFSLVKKAKKVIALELDQSLVGFLSAKLISDNFTLINGDILTFDLTSLEDNKLIFVSNLPYYISTKIIFKIASDVRFQYVNVMLQKELVDRIFAKPKTKAYGRLTVSINSLFELVAKINVPAECFNPKPNVDSGFIVLKRKEPDFEIEPYLSFVKDCFANKRKKLLNSLKNSNSPYLNVVQDYLSKNNLSINLRAEEIAIDDFIKMWKEIN